MKSLLEESFASPLLDLALVKVRPAGSFDRERIRTILEATGVFNLAEVQCALSLLDVTVEKGDDPDEYVFRCAGGPDEAVLGFVCYGKASLADRVYDLYWIATDPSFQSQGIGSLLMRDLDERLVSLGARMVLAETSSRSDYAGTHRFYERHGFSRVATVKDYYALGEDLMIFEKRYR